MTTATRQIEKGYKQTEIGMIPADWEMLPFGKIALLRKQKYDSRKEGGNEFCVELEHIGQGTGMLIGHSVTTESSSIKNVFKKDDVLFGRLRAYLKKYWQATRDGVSSSEIWSLVASNQYTVPDYIFQTVQTDRFIEASAESYGTHMPRTDWNAIKNLLIPLPSTKAEQFTIATALSDGDTLIERLEKLIEKKKNIKQGATQELLTGKRRLPGFSGKWEVKRLGDIFHVTRGQVLAMTRTTKERIGEYKYPVYSSQTKDNGLAGYYKDYLFENCITWTTDGANAGDVKYRTGKFYCTNVCGVLENNEGYSNPCIATIFNSVSKKYVSYVGNPKLMNNIVADIKIVVPSSIEEQVAISTILSDMDTEIEKLKSQLTKYQNLKQGMMQVLLTGKIRLLSK